MKHSGHSKQSKKSNES
jgi:hypothetical protein